MKKITIIGIIIFLIAFVIYVIIEINYGWYMKISSKVEKVYRAEKMLKIFCENN